MSTVRFATVCDRCGNRGPEYLAHTLVCAQCERDVCASCCHCYDPDPPGHAICKDCTKPATQMTGAEYGERYGENDP